MKRKDFERLIDSNNLEELFITEMGWNTPSRKQPIYITIDEQDYDFVPVADKSGFQVYSCTLPSIPVASLCKKIDNKLRPYGVDYICVFIEAGTSHHLWLTPVKTNEKRELVKTEYISGAKAAFLFSKIDDLSFDLTEEVLIMDVKQRVQSSFKLNSEKVTKEFYAQFNKEHLAFMKHIRGIDDDIPDKDNKNKEWYASIMLNRLMFCYFIQKKGFLDNNKNYLTDKLKWVREKQGAGEFFETFYKGFLCALFHDGLNNPRHDTQEFRDKYGCIPYLNGGMFDDHQLERENAGIDIADEAFEKLFAFFDKWNWHLDTRLSASGKDINPDVLGYIFEQYINNRAMMGAYYTKEDITEYIGKNCIIPFLMDKTAEKSPNAFKPTGFVWAMLKESGDKYIYDAVKKGHTSDWQDRIPDYIRQGIDTRGGNLLERRNHWNEKTFDAFALPTEIWRETVERLQRCDTLISKIGGGEITSINDFITYNLDIRQFVEDVVRTTDDHLFVEHFYEALQHVSILDPTCGSGAFLFAALNILEPLYEACLDRMEEWNKQNNNLFVNQLNEMNVKYSSNRQYFIYKSIILRNLYGVDIMVEATEIAKLRLFLKMVAVVEVDKSKGNLGLDPLPDIDFNIKCGNTLVGYATEDELNKALAYGDMFANKEFKTKIDSEMHLVATAYNLFRSEQLKAFDDNSSIKETKDELKKRLAALNDLLNKYMYKSIAAGTNYNTWLASHQPFHWLAEFYQIIQGNGGFDVIIGNPPYVGYTRKNKTSQKAVCEVYKVNGLKTLPTSNLYSFTIERTSNIISRYGEMGMIIPISAFANDSMKELQQLFRDTFDIHISTFHQRPAQLFEGVLQRLSIFIASKSSSVPIIYTTGINRWYSDTRSNLFHNLSFVKVSQDKQQHFIKVGTEIEVSIFNKYCKDKKIKEYLAISPSVKNNIYYRTAGGGYWVTILNEEFDCVSVSNKHASFISDVKSDIFCAAINSNLFWWYYSINYDLFNFKDYMIFGFQLTYPNENTEEIRELSQKLEKSLRKNAIYYEINSQTRGKNTTVTYDKSRSKSIMDEIDKVLAKHYGFTDEELDFIINYDIKYRMGDELGGDE
ncbi:MAG: Eco57I restriction-modification methylase domain-containing protein [Bacteroidaceae bacterium]|nr:Eco57I restriction-modification methylase domain-containing protein [Bacteroidaceae bacterium]